MEKILTPYISTLNSFYKKNFTLNNNPENLYEPIEYTLNNKGKCIRYSLVLMAEELFIGEIKNSFHSALSMEWFHNFTLIHDDIMDNADIRRGKTSVYKKWGTNTAILSGDVLLIKVYELLNNNYKGNVLNKILTSFNDTAIKVCEGQQMDIDFETTENIYLKDYLKMIKYKTAVLIANSLKTGAIISNTSTEDINNMYNFGLNLGIAFQIQDDFLDVFSREKTLGKKQGGDIIEGKKTFLYLKALELCNDIQKEYLKKYYSKGDINNVISIFNDLDIKNLVDKEIDIYFKKSISFLEKIDTTFKEKKENLLLLSSEIMKRVY